MAEPYFAKPVTVTDERLREATERQARQRALRDQLDSQLAQQREAGNKAQQPMTRAQRHRHRIMMEQQEAQLAQAHPLGGTFQPMSGNPFLQYQQQPPSPLYQPPAPQFPAQQQMNVRSSLNGPLPGVYMNQPSTAMTGENIYYVGSNGGLAPLSPRGMKASVSHSPRIPSPPTELPPKVQYVRTQSNSPPMAPTSFLPSVASAAAGAAFPYPQMQVPANPMQIPSGTMSNQELMQWLDRATDQIVEKKMATRQSTTSLPGPPQAPKPTTVGTSNTVLRSLGIPTVYDYDEIPQSSQPTQQLPAEPMPMSRGGIQTRGNGGGVPPSRQQSKSRGEDAKEQAKLNRLQAELDAQRDRLRKMQEREKTFEEQVKQLQTTLKEAKKKEKELLNASLIKRRQTMKQRADTAPKPDVSGKFSQENHPKPQQPGKRIQLNPLTDENGVRPPTAPGQDILPPLLENVRGIIAKKPLGPVPTADAKSPTKVKVCAPAEHPVPSQQQPLSYHQLLALAEKRLLSHKQVQKLWEFFSKNALGHQEEYIRRDGAVNQFDLGPATPLQTYETFEELVDDGDDDY